MDDGWIDLFLASIRFSHPHVYGNIFLTLHIFYFRADFLCGLGRVLCVWVDFLLCLFCGLTTCWIH